MVSDTETTLEKVNEEQSRLGESRVRAARVDHIVELMSTFQFKRGETAKALAKEWGLSIDYVHHMTAEASKRVAAAVMDSDAVRAKVGLALDLVLASCVQDNGIDGKHVFRDEKTAIANRKALIEAAAAWSRIAGADAPKRTEISGPDGGPIQAVNATLESMSEAERERAIRDHIRRQDEQAAKALLASAEPEPTALPDPPKESSSA